MEDINLFNIEDIKDNSTVLIIGKNETGRTELATNIINHKFPTDTGIVFVNKRDFLRYSGFNTSHICENAKYMVVDDVTINKNIFNNEDILRIIITDYIDIVNIPNIDYIISFNNPYLVHKKILQLYDVNFKNPIDHNCIVIRLSDKAIFRYNSRHVSDDYINKFITDDTDIKKNSNKCIIL